MITPNGAVVSGEIVESTGKETIKGIEYGFKPHWGTCTAPEKFRGKGGKSTDFNTKATRKASYEAVLPKINKRSRLILDTLGAKEMTVSEIADELEAAGKIPYYNRNYVAPRLTELKELGVVETCGRRKSTRSPATEAVWRRAEPKQEVQF